MARGKGQVVVFVTGETKDLQRSLSEADKALAKFGDSSAKAGEKLTSAGKKMTLFATVPIAAAMGAATKAASDLNETVSKSNTVFGSAAASVESWADGAAKGFGQSKQEALDAASTFGNLFVQLGVGSEAAAGLSTQMVELSSDFASFHNAAPLEVTNAMTAAFRGEYDAVQRFVPVINAAAVEQQALADTGKSATSALTQQEKALAVQTLLVQGAGDAMGDFARTQDSLANQTRIAQAELKDSAATLGTTLLPIMSKVAGGAADIAGAFGDLPGPVQTGVLALAGVVAATGPILTVVGNLQKLKAAIAAVQWANVASGATAAAGALGLVAAGAASAYASYVVFEKAFGKDSLGDWNALRDAFKGTAGALDDTGRAALAAYLDSRKMTDAFAAAGISVDDLHAALVKGDPALEALRKRLVATGEISGNASGQIFGIRNAFEEGSKSGRKLNAVLGEEAGAQRGAAAGAGEHAGALDDVAAAKRRVLESSMGYERALLGLEEANNAVAEAQRGNAGSGKSLVDRQRELQDAAIAVEDAQRGVADAHRSVEDAQRGVEEAAERVDDALRAQQDAARNVTDAMRGIADAERGVVEAHDRIAESARNLVEAEEGVADAQQRVIARQKDLDRLLNGYGKGSDEAADATENLDDRQRDLLRSQLAVTSAQEKLNAVRGDVTATADDVARAELDLADAEDQLEGATKTLDEAQKALTETLNGVPAGSDKARQAQQDLKDAEDDLEAAERRVIQAAKDQDAAHRGLESAHRGVEQASRDLETAQRGVLEVADDVEEAHRGVEQAARDLDAAHRGVASAVRDAQRAQEDRAEALRGDTSASGAAGQQRDLATALLDQKQAYIDVADAYVERAADVAEANGKTMTATEKADLFKQKLGELAGTLAPNAPLRKELEAYIGQIDAIPTEKKTTVTTIYRQIHEGVQGLFGGGRSGDGPGATGRASTAFGMAAEAASMFGGSITSGYRSPAKNASINGSPTSYHLDPDNPAQDLAGPNMQAMFDYLAENYGDKVRELIYGNTMIKRGKRMPYRRNDHWDHVHVAHDGGEVSSSWPTIPGLRSDERPVITQVGETITPKGAPSSVTNNHYNVTVNAGMGTDPRALEDAVTTALVNVTRRGGSLTSMGVRVT